MRTRTALVGLLTAGLLLTGCAASPQAELNEATTTLVERANAGDADGVRDAADALAGVVRRQAGSSLDAAEVRRLLALIGEVRDGADLLEEQVEPAPEPTEEEPAEESPTPRPATTAPPTTRPPTTAPTTAPPTTPPPTTAPPTTAPTTTAPASGTSGSGGGNGGGNGGGGNGGGGDDEERKDDGEDDGKDDGKDDRKDDRKDDGGEPGAGAAAAVAPPAAGLLPAPSGTSSADPTSRPG